MRHSAPACCRDLCPSGSGMVTGTAGNPGGIVLSVAEGAAELFQMIRQVGLIVTMALVFCRTSLAQTYPAGFSGTNLATGLSDPTAFCIAPDGTIYICLQDGEMRVWKPGPGLLSDEFFLN